MKLQQQKDKIRESRINYFKKKYEEVFGEKPPAAFRPSTYEYILLKYPDNASVDAYIDTLDTMSWSDLSYKYYNFYEYQSDIEMLESKLPIQNLADPLYYKIKYHFLLADKSYELMYLYRYGDVGTGIKTLADALNVTPEDIIDDYIGITDLGEQIQELFHVKEED